MTDDHGDNGRVLHGHVVLLKTARNNHSQLEWVITAFLYTAFEGKFIQNLTQFGLFVY